MPKRNRKEGRSAEAAAALPASSGKAAMLWEKADPWLPWTVAGMFLAVMSFLTFRYHTVGGLGVETDFYAELFPQAKKLIEGEFSPLNYGPKGPVYSFFLAGTYLFVREFFQAGLVLNLLTAAGFLVVFYFLARRVFNPLTAAAALLAVSLNYMFLNYAYQAGSDMPFMLLCALSLLFLFRDGGKRDLALSAVFGTLAFLTRYNGAFVPAGAMTFFAFSDGTRRERLRKAGIWLGVFLAAGMPWFIPNWIVAGSPVKNDNYMNVMMEFYALGMGAQYENWTDALPRQFTGMRDIILHDPLYFISHWAKNALAYFLADIGELIGWGAGVFVLSGMAALIFVRPVKTRLLYLVFGLFYSLILALVFYNSRFSLFLLAIYIPFAVWPFTLAPASRFLRWLFRGAIAAFVIVTVLGGVSSARRVYAEIQFAPTFLKEMGRELGKREPDKSQKVMARKPHVAYYAGLEAIMFPESPRTVEELVAHSREHDIRYIVYTGVEAQVRPSLQQALLNLEEEKPGLHLEFYNRFGIVYRVD